MYTNSRIILGCTEIKTDITIVSMAIQKNTFSSYKHYHTLKFSIAVAPYWIITYVSSFFPGFTTDKIITLKSSILSQIEPADLILTKYYLIRNILPTNFI